MMKQRIFLMFSLIAMAMVAMGQGKICDQQMYDRYITAAKQGDAEAQYQIVNSYCIPEGVDDAVAWLLKAAEQGHVNAIKAVIALYSGNSESFKNYADQKEASRWWLKWADLGSVQAMAVVASLYYVGNGLEQDNKKALSWARKAVAHPNPDNLNGVAWAEALLGMFYWNGVAEEQSDEQAYYWFKRACEHGTEGEFLGMAQYFLGKAYYNGEGVQQDYSQAVLLFEKAVANGYKQSESWLERARKKQEETLLAARKQKAPVEEKLPMLPKKADVMNVDENIPQTNQKDIHTFAVIIGNEQYESEAAVPFAEHDAAVFKEYVQRTFGVPENQINFITNAGLNKIRSAVRWLKDAMESAGGQGKVIVYYAGHGIPDEANKDAYLLPVDGIGSDVESAYPLTRLYKELGALPAERITVFLDACFSGAKREGDMMASARGVAIKVKETVPQGKMIVFTAAQGDETAYPFKSQKHGMFTYYLLKKLQETHGNATLGEIGDYLTTEVKRQSFVENNKVQTPSIVPSAGMQDTWRALHLNQ